jgi:arabinogalactan oligomer/maltooligosaccharide transport system permease protein
VKNYRSLKYKKETKIAFWLLVPALIAITFATLIPSFYNIYISFTNYGLYHYFDYDFIGFDNYKEIFRLQSPLYSVLIWTVIWMFASTLLNYFCGMLIALLLNNPNLKERNIYRTLLIIPWALPGVIAIQMWQGMLNMSGVFNQILDFFGVSPVNWLNKVFWARFWVIAVNIWLSFPYFMTITNAALKSIPNELYEAAKVDGASSTQRFRKITFPLLNRTLAPLLVTQLAFQFNNFNLIYLLTFGGPREALGEYYGATDILVSYTFTLMREVQRYGLTAAYGVITFFITVFIMVITTFSIKALKEEF